MIDFTLLSVFIPTVFLISLTPGMCMTLAMTLGMSIGVKKTLFMMWGELLGVAIVAIAAVLGVASLMLNYPTLFIALKWCGAAYLSYLAWNMWHSKGKLSLTQAGSQSVTTSSKSLFSQGLITALANPKGWAFMVSLLPPFIKEGYALHTQLIVLVSILLMSEFICMMMYATGGKTVAKLISNESNVKLMNRVSGSLMFAIALWLILG